MRMALKFRCIAAIGLLGLLASCSDPVPPASQGSASVHLQNSAGASCGPGVHWANAPTAKKGSVDQTSGTNRSPDIVVDGEQGRHFSCAVKPTGDTFSVTGDMNVPAFDEMTNMLLPIPTRITLSIPSIGKDQSGAMGSFLVADNKGAGAALQSSTCQFSVKADTATNAKLAIAAGKIWGSVTCTGLKDSKDPASSCDVDVGYFVMENCDQ